MKFKGNITVLTLALFAAISFSANASIITMGDGAIAVYDGDVAIGDNSSATGKYDPVSGINQSATAINGSANGAQTFAAAGGNAYGDYAVAIAGGNAQGQSTVSVGAGSSAGSAGDISIGEGTGTNSGYDQDFNYVGTNDPNHSSVAIGAYAGHAGADSVSLGASAGRGSSQLGYVIQRSTSIGTQSAAGTDGTALGYHAYTTGNGVALGAGASNTANNGIAIGANTTNDRDNAAAFGNRQLVQVAAGTQDTDAANVGQIRQLATGLGGGANFDYTTGTFVAPTYNLSGGNTFNNVGDALTYLDNRISNIDTSGGGTSTPGPVGPQGPQGIQGETGASAYDQAIENGFVGTETEWLESLKGADGKDGVGSGTTVKAGKNTVVMNNDDGTQTVDVADNIQLSDQGSLKVGSTTVDANGVTIQGGPSVTTAGVDAGNKQVTNVADGRIEAGSTDAVNGGQIYEMQQDLDDRWTNVDRRLIKQDKRIDGLGAQVGAMTMMAAAASANGGQQIGEVRANAGVGFSGNQAAIAIGASIRVSEKISVSGGMSFGTGNKPVAGIGISFSLGR